MIHGETAGSAWDAKCPTDSVVIDGPARSTPGWARSMRERASSRRHPKVKAIHSCGEWLGGNHSGAGRPKKRPIGCAGGPKREKMAAVRQEHAPDKSAMSRSNLATLRLLGAFTVEVSAARPVAIAVRSRKARGLLAYLAMKPDWRASREELATLLWGDNPDAQ